MSELYLKRSDVRAILIANGNGLSLHDIDKLEPLTADDIKQLRKDNDLMYRTLQTIAANASNGLQRTQAIGALANIGPKICDAHGDRADKER